MGKPTGFKEYLRAAPPERDPKARVGSWNEFKNHLPDAELQLQGARCMDCGVPFCHTGDLMANGASGCPINNLIPEWNDLVYKNTGGRHSSAFIKLTTSLNSLAEYAQRLARERVF